MFSNITYDDEFENMFSNMTYDEELALHLASLQCLSGTCVKRLSYILRWMCHHMIYAAYTTCLRQVRSADADFEAL